MRRPYVFFVPFLESVAGVIRVVKYTLLAFSYLDLIGGSGYKIAILAGAPVYNFLMRGLSVADHYFFFMVGGQVGGDIFVRHYRARWISYAVEIGTSSPRGFFSEIVGTAGSPKK